MSQKKKQIKGAFKDACFKRDKFRCVMCGYQSSTEKAEQELYARRVVTDLPNDGYAPENGVTLCKVGENCHLKSARRVGGYEPATLYAVIDSSYERAVRASQCLGRSITEINDDDLLKMGNRLLHYDDVGILTDEQMLLLWEQAMTRRITLDLWNVPTFQQVYVMRHPEENNNPSDKIRRLLRPIEKA